MRITPRLPSSSESRISSTQRAKLGSTSVAEAISRDLPRAACRHRGIDPVAHTVSRLRGYEQAGRDRGQALAATGEPQAVGGRGADRDADAVPLGDAALGLLAARGEPRAVADQLAGDVADLPAGGAHAAQGLGEQVVARLRRPTRARSAEVAAEVAEPGRGEQRVADRVQHHVAVGVSLEAQRPPRANPVRPPASNDRVRGDGRRCRCRCAGPRARSCRRIRADTWSARLARERPWRGEPGDEQGRPDARGARPRQPPREPRWPPAGRSRRPVSRGLLALAGVLAGAAGLALSQAAARRSAPSRARSRPWPPPCGTSRPGRSRCSSCTWSARATSRCCSAARPPRCSRSAATPPRWVRRFPLAAGPGLLRARGDRAGRRAPAPEPGDRRAARAHRRADHLDRHAPAAHRAAARRDAVSSPFDSRRRAFLVRARLGGRRRRRADARRSVRGSGRRHVEQARRLLRLPVSDGTVPAGASPRASRHRAVAHARTTTSTSSTPRSPRPRSRRRTGALRIHGMVDQRAHPQLPGPDRPRSSPRPG